MRLGPSVGVMHSSYLALPDVRAVQQHRGVRTTPRIFLVRLHADVLSRLLVSCQRAAVCVAGVPAVCVFLRLHACASQLVQRACKERRRGARGIVRQQLICAISVVRVDPAYLLCRSGQRAWYW